MYKEANLIIVGGTIAAGKSTLVKNIAKQTGGQPVPELRKDDKIQDIVLAKLYEGTRLHLATVQYYFISNRYKQYKEEHNKMITSIMDRGLGEDGIFAKLLMVDEPKSYEHYKALWRTTIEKILKLYGKPKAYIYARVDGETFRKRIFGRNREAEIKNFSANEDYFKELLKEYNENFVGILADGDIEPIIIDTTELSKEEVTEEAMKQLRIKGLVK